MQYEELGRVLDCQIGFVGWCFEGCLDSGEFFCEIIFSVIVGSSFKLKMIGNNGDILVWD